MHIYLKGNEIGIQQGNLTIGGSDEAPFYRKFIMLNNDEDGCCSKNGVTFRESIYNYFGVFGKKYKSQCLGSMRIYHNPGIH